MEHVEIHHINTGGVGLLGAPPISVYFVVKPNNIVHRVSVDDDVTGVVLSPSNERATGVFTDEVLQEMEAVASVVYAALYKEGEESVFPRPGDEPFRPS